MSQFKDTEHANESFRTALQGYKEDKERCNRILSIIKEGATVMPMDIEWVCKRAIKGIDAQESSWYSHD